MSEEEEVVQEPGPTETIEESQRRTIAALVARAERAEQALAWERASNLKKIRLLWQRWRSR